MVQWLSWILMLGLLSAWPATPSHAQPRPADKRIALVIGNSQYPKVPLSNPENDARLIAINLRKLGFDVDEQLNLDVLHFRRVLREFARRVQQDDAIAVLYYAGHGLQIDGRNYLLPVDVNLRDQEEVKDESVDIDELFLSRIDKVGSYPRIVILDACRNNPFASKTRNIRSAGGLAEMGARGTLIAFASSPGASAEDGPNGGNSVYTKNLAEEIMILGLEVEQMFKNVRVKVLRDTDGRQLPWVNTSLTSNFSFNPGTNRPLTQQAARQEIQRPQAGAAQAQREPEAAVTPRPSSSTSDSSTPASAPPAVSSGGPVAGRTEPKDIETVLERARRERDSMLAAAPKSIPPSAPPSEPPPAPSSATHTESASTPMPISQARKFLDRDEMQQLFVGKTHSLKDTSTNDLMRWDLRSGGLIYYNAQSPGYLGVSGSGRWELKNDGSLCVKFNAAPPAQPGARRPDDGCWYFFRDGEKLKRVSVALPQAQPQVEIVKIQ